MSAVEIKQLVHIKMLAWGSELVMRALNTYKKAL